jgi:hypothetical protein
LRILLSTRRVFTDLLSRIKTLKGPRRTGAASSVSHDNPLPPAASTKTRATAAPARAATIANICAQGLAAFNPNPQSTGGFNPAPPSASGFNFGPDPNAGAASNPFAQQQSTPGGSLFGQSQQQNASGAGIFAFGSNSTSSFPPAQSATPSNPFAQSTNASFPPASGFGGSNAGGASPFNPQPDLNFSATTPAPASSFTFGAQSSQTPAFGASQNNAAGMPAANEFTFLGSAAKNNESAPASGGIFTNNNASTSAPTGGLFSTNSTTQNSIFGGFGSNGNSSTAAPASPFGNSIDNAKTSSTPFQFGANSQAPSTPFAGGSTLFGTSTPGFAFGAQSNGPNGLTTQGETASTPAFSFGNSIVNPATPATSNNLFGNFGMSTNVPTSTPASVGLGGFGGFGQLSQAPSISVPAATSLPSLFTQSQAQAPTGPIATPLTKPSDKGSRTGPTKNTKKFSLSQYVSPFSYKYKSILKPKWSMPKDQPSVLPPGAFPLVPSVRPNRTKMDKDQVKVSNTYRRSTEASQEESASTETTAQPPLPQTPFEASQEEPAPTEAAAQSALKQTQFEAPRPAQTHTSEEPATNPFAKISSVPASSSFSNSLFTPAKPTSTSNTSSNNLFTPAIPAAPTPKPALSGTPASAKEPTNNVPVPQISRATVPPNWTVPDDDSNDLREHIKMLEQINDVYRTKIVRLPARADWSALSKWHSHESSKLKKKIDDIRKQTAAAKGITGEESILSTKRKTGESAQLDSSFKKARSGEAPTTPNAKTDAPALPSTTPKSNFPSKGFNLFAHTSTPQTSSVSDETVQRKAVESKDSTPQGGFKPTFGTSASSSAIGFKPNFGASSKTVSSGSGGFFGQFGGKTKEQLREERMKKAMDAGYESPTTSEEAEGDYETREQWLARWKKEDDDRQAALDAAASNAKLTFAPTATNQKADAPIFKLTAASSNGASSSDSIVASQGFASGTSTPGFLRSRVSSPAPLTEGARSVLDTPLGAQTPSSNFFGHLSSASSQHQDDSDDEADDEAAARLSVEEESKKRKLGNVVDVDSESSETLEESMRRKKPDTQTSNLFNRTTSDNSDDEQGAADTSKKAPSLAGRMTRDNSETASDVQGKEDGQLSLNANNSKLFNIHGSQTPAPKKSFQFDFAGAAKAAPQSAPPKQNPFGGFGGDQTFKFGDPIKFGSSTNTNSTFTVTPATPPPVSSAGLTTVPPKAVSSPFSFLSTVPSAATSTMSSRAATPASDADASATEGTAVNEEEGQTYTETDKSILTSEETAEFSILFEAEQVIANKQIHKEGASKAEWAKIANGRLWILKSKADNHVIVRLRMKSGAVRVNYRIPPIIKSAIMGANKTQVLVKEPAVKDGKTVLENLIFAFNHKDKATKQELAKAFSDSYNENVPSA